MFKLFITIVTILLFTGCSFKSNSAKYSLNYTGVYIGTLPCAACKGVRTVLKLTSNGRYEKELVYLGNKIESYYAKGSYSWHPNGNIIYLDDSSAYFVEKNKLFTLDSEDKKISGNLAQRYILTKFGIKYLFEDSNKTKNGF